MNITEVTTEGLRRELKVVVGADELERRLSARLDDLKGRVRIKGFRPGHVPKAHLRKVYGRSVMAEVVQQAVAETSREAISQRQERPAFQPNIALPEDEKEIDKIFSGSRRPRLHHVLRGAAQVRRHGLRQDRGGEADCRGDLRRHRQGARTLEQRQSALQGERRSGRGRRPADHRLQGLDRRRGIHRAAAPRMRKSCSAAATSFRASRKASPAPRPASSAPSTRPSRPTIPKRGSPERPPAST